MSNYASMQMEWKLSQNTCSLKMFLAEVGEEEKTQRVVRHDIILDIIEGATTIT